MALSVDWNFWINHSQLQYSEAIVWIISKGTVFTMTAPSHVQTIEAVPQTCFLVILNKFTIDTQVNATESLIYLTMNVVALTVSHMKLTPSLSNPNFHSLKILSI